MDIARSASQGAHYHADVINLLEITESLPTKAPTDQEKGCNQSLPPLNHAKNARTNIAGTGDFGVRARYQFVLGRTYSHVSIPTSQNSMIVKVGLMIWGDVFGQIQTSKRCYELAFVFRRDA